MLMHYCTCQINLAGQGFHIVQILATEPMSWPEIQAMMAMHGEENIFDIKPVAVFETNVVAEKRRLMAKYRGQQRLIEQVFPGRSPQMELTVPGEPTNQPPADEYGLALKQQAAALSLDDDEPEVLGRDPPTGPAVFKPVGHRRSLDGPPGAS
jgi:hypothetical protein